MWSLRKSRDSFVFFPLREASGAWSEEREGGRGGGVGEGGKGRIKGGRGGDRERGKGREGRREGREGGEGNREGGRGEEGERGRGGSIFHSKTNMKYHLCMYMAIRWIGC